MATRCTWTVPSVTGSSGIVSYQLERKLASSSIWAVLATLPASTLTYDDLSVVDGASYDYRVAARNADLLGAYSPVRTITIPGGTSSTPSAPTALVGTDIGNGSLQATWGPPLSDNGSPVTAYRVVIDVGTSSPSWATFGPKFPGYSDGYGGPTSTTTTTTYTVGASPRSFLFTGLLSGGYVVRVFAINAVGVGPSIFVLRGVGGGGGTLPPPPPPPPDADRVVLGDFNTGTTWDPAVWQLAGTSGSSFGIDSGDGVISIGTLGSDGDRARARSVQVFDRGTVFCEIEVFSTAEHLIAVSVCEQDTGPLGTPARYYPADGYFVDFNPSTGYTRLRVSTGNVVTTLSAVTLPYAVGTKHKVLLDPRPSGVVAFVWPSTAAQPAAPNLTSTNTTYSSGRVGISLQGSVAALTHQLEVDDVIWNRTTTGAPTGLTAVANPDRSVTLDWADFPGFNPTTDVYRVWEDATPGAPVATVTVSTRTSGALADGSYFYAVSAVIGGVETLRSAKVSVVVPAVAPPPSGSTFTRTLDDVVYDHFGAPLRTDGLFPTYGRHERALAGVNPAFDWTHGARPGDTGPYPSSSVRDHHNIWGQVTVGGTATPERRVRVQIADWQVWHLRSGTWVQVADDAAAGEIEGAFQSGAQYLPGLNILSGSARKEVEGYSIDLTPATNSDGTPNSTNTFCHWYYKGFYPRKPIMAGTTAIAMVCRMRLITDVAGVNVDAASFVGAVGGDLYADPSDPGGNANAAFSIPRHKVLTSGWKSFTDVTGTEAQIRAYPAMPFVTGTSAPVLPSAPLSVTSTVAGSTATLSWQPPATPGGTVTGYYVERDGVDSFGGGAWNTTLLPTARSLTFQYLVGGATYNLRVAAVTAAGQGTLASVPTVIPAGTAVRTTSASAVRRSQEVVNIYGVAGHMAYDDGNYADKAQVTSALSYLGVKNFRDGWGTGRQSIADWVISDLRPRGIKLCLVDDRRDWPAGYTATQRKDQHKAYGYFNDIAFVEGENERDLSGDIAGARAQALAMHAVYKNDPDAAHILRCSPSLADTNTDSKYQALGVQPDAQAVTFHDYPGVDRMMNDTILNTLGRNARYVIPTASGTPVKVISTECGFSSGTTGDAGKNMPDFHRARQEVRVWLEHARGLGSGDRAQDCVLSCNYELVDQETSSALSTDTERKFGLFTRSWTPKLPAQVLSRTIGLLTDPSPAALTFQPSAPIHTLSGGNSATRSLVMQKADGSWWIAVWQQVLTWNGSADVTPAGVNVTVTVPTARAGVLHSPVDNAAALVLGSTTTFTFASHAMVKVLALT